MTLDAIYYRYVQITQVLPHKALLGYINVTHLRRLRKSRNFHSKSDFLMNEANWQ